MCVTNDEQLAAKLMKLRVHGMEPKYYHELIGGNFRLDEIQAAVLNVKLPHLDAWSAARQRNAAFYDAAFAARRARPAKLARRRPRRPARATSTTSTASAPRAATSCGTGWREQGVGTEIYYPLALHMQQCFAYLGHSPEDFPESLRATQETLALPIYPELSESQLQYVVDTIAALIRRIDNRPMAHDNMTAVWRALQARATETRAVSLRALRDADPRRGTRFAREAVRPVPAISRASASTTTACACSTSLADAAGLRAHIDAMWRGEAINTTEGRAVLHTALRVPRRVR